MYAERIRRLTERQRQAGVDCTVLMPGPNLRYLTGLDLFVSERPILMFAPSAGRPQVLLPMLEEGRVQAQMGESADLVSYSDQEGPEPAFARVAEALALDGKQIAVEYRHMRVLELRALEGVVPRALYLSFEAELPALRTIKDQEEISRIRCAIAITEAALGDLVAQPLLGLSEREIANKLAQGMMRAGAQRIGFIIVVAGPNSADPHAGPSDRPLQAGDLITVDCGVVHEGYLADITRTFACGHLSEELQRVYDTVLRANAAARDAARAGIRAQDLDRAARQVIGEAGYGEFFVHRTGHGLGLEEHEPPYLVEGNEQPLHPGMVFTIEPGIYIRGLGGVRIEDDVVITDAGAETLTAFPRELTILT
jgi:Xaa-Pro dipeptidase